MGQVFILDTAPKPVKNENLTPLFFTSLKESCLLICGRPGCSPEQLDNSGYYPLCYQKMQHYVAHARRRTCVTVYIHFKIVT